MLGAAALKRAVRLGETDAAPRVSDLPALVASTAGKVELETLGDEVPEERVVDRLLARAIQNVFRRLVDIDEPRRGGRGLRGRARASRPASWCRPPTTCAGCARRPGCDAVVHALGADGIAGRGRVGCRVRARGAASQSAAEQGPDRRPAPATAATSPTWRRPRTSTGSATWRTGASAATDRARPFRYLRWDGSQRLADLTADDVLAELSDDLLAESDLTAALAGC